MISDEGNSTVVPLALRATPESAAMPPWAMELLKKVESSNVAIQEMKNQHEVSLSELKQQNDDMRKTLNVIEKKSGGSTLGLIMHNTGRDINYASSYPILSSHPCSSSSRV
jgi:hypothetical protein